MRRRRRRRRHSAEVRDFLRVACAHQPEESLRAFMDPLAAAVCCAAKWLKSSGEKLSEFPGLDELTSARILGRLLYAVAGASSKPSSRTLETSENTELLRSP